MSDQKQMEEPPPFLHGWNAWYALVLIVLVAVIALFTWVTRVFS